MESVFLQRETTSTASKGSTFFKPTIQKKLSVGSATDSYEVEADIMANRVMSMKTSSKTNVNQTGSLVQRKCAACEQEEKIQKKPLAESITPLIQRSSSEKGGEASTQVENQINSSKGNGATMDGETKNFMETRFGTDFSDVKIHTGSQAVQMSRELNAHAFTVGNDIYFNEGKYNPNSDSGKHLLAHELTHTVQQSGGIDRKIQKLSISRVSRTSGTCGRRSVKWDFTLGSAASSDGYLVQKVDVHEIKSSGCPSISGPPAPILTFWEAFPVASGAKTHGLQPTIGYSDESGYGSNPGTNGTSASYGEVKFFLKSVTGDLGGFSTAPATPGAWGPGRVPRSGIVPSTASEPSWWSGSPTEGPENRMASSEWDCCSTPNVSNITSNP
ncbi:DUF4157 domain-containing protein [Flavobacterium sp.]|uniref:eCIS core domain-containing protein n=1 Tax=Flavobacterium sp. TaxID=239 RepID=UPI0025BB493B|nr:DUF4157 domain-containing protein [Flavobacterium sp.]